jgi:hypothetical protein
MLEGVLLIYFDQSKLEYYHFGLIDPKEAVSFGQHRQRNSKPKQEGECNLISKKEASGALNFFLQDKKKASNAMQMKLLSL